MSVAIKISDGARKLSGTVATSTDILPSWKIAQRFNTGFVMISDQVPTGTTETCLYALHAASFFSRRMPNDTSTKSVHLLRVGAGLNHSVGLGLMHRIFQALKCWAIAATKLQFLEFLRPLLKKAFDSDAIKSCNSVRFCLVRWET